MTCPGYPGKKATSTPITAILECIHSHTHTDFISLDCVNESCKIRIEDTTNGNLKEDRAAYGKCSGTLVRLGTLICFIYA